MIKKKSFVNFVQEKISFKIYLNAQDVKAFGNYILQYYCYLQNLGIVIKNVRKMIG
jgi:hypothetical protein